MQIKLRTIDNSRKPSALSSLKCSSGKSLQNHRQRDDKFKRKEIILVAKMEDALILNQLSDRNANNDVYSESLNFLQIKQKQFTNKHQAQQAFLRNKKDFIKKYSKQT